MSKKKRILKPWHFVMTGVLMTVISALLSHYVIAKQTDRIEELTSKSQNVEQTIQQLWENARVLESKKDISVVLMSLPDETYTINFITYILHDIGEKLENRDSISREDAFLFLREKVLAHKARTVEMINDLYGEKLAFDDEILAIERENTDYNIFALFFQILGLALVVSRDLVK